MKIILAILIFVLSSSEAYALNAFPGAIGFGASATGGRVDGTQLVFVTNTNDSGTGSLRAAAAVVGPKIIVVKASGTIQLTDNIIADEDNMTIFGSTSPGGLCLANAGIRYKCKNTITRGLIIRPGDRTDTGSAVDNRDCVQIEESAGTGTSNHIIDHCSLTWASDETISTWHPDVANVTISSCLIGEALADSIHPDGIHAMGVYFHYQSSKISFYRNLLANTKSRNPLLRGDEIEIISNIFYNRETHGIRIGDPDHPTQTFRVNIIGNYLKRGLNWDTVWPHVMILPAENTGTTAVYDTLNYSSGYGALDFYTDEENVVGTPAFTGAGTSFAEGSTIYSSVLASVGARPWDRDVIDTRIVQQVVDGTGTLYDTVTEAGGYPTLSGSYPTDTDSDGIPDAWESAHGMNPSANDALSDTDSDGYLNIEEYANSFYETESARRMGVNTIIHGTGSYQ